MIRIYLSLLVCSLLSIDLLDAQEPGPRADLELNGRDYFHMPGLDVTVFSDYYPEGHQSGVTVIQHGNRVAANGDIRLEPSPGQWSPVPAAGERKVDAGIAYWAYGGSTRDDR